MAALGMAAQTAAITTGTSAKTLVQIVAPTNQRLKVRAWSVSFAGIAPTDAPILCKLVRQTDAGTSSALTPVVTGSGVVAETPQSTARHTATVEPTATDVLRTEEVHPQGGFQERIADGEIVVPGGGRLGIQVTAGVSVSAVARIEYEE